MTNTNVLISILNWNGGESTIDCIRSILNSTYKNFNILVIDNASSDSSVENIRKTFHEIEIIQNTVNRGFAAAQNQGIKFAAINKIEYVWILNNDTIVEPDTLGLLMAEIESNKEIGMVSPVILEGTNEKSLQFCGCSADLRNFKFDHFTSINDAAESQDNAPDLFCLWGTALLARTTLLNQIGCFDEEYFAYYEDLDLSLRVINEGYFNRIVVSATISHGGHNDPSKRPPHYVYYNTRNRFYFWKKRLSFLRLIRFTRYYLAGALILASNWREKDNIPKENATLMGLWDGLISHTGEWEQTRSFPAFLKILVNHSYFFADLLQGKFSKILAKHLRISRNQKS